MDQAAGEVGDVDPVAAVFGLLTLAIGVWAGWLSARALRLQRTQADTALRLLADAVLAAERDARSKILGAHDKTIDVEFDLRPAGAQDAEGAASAGHLAEIVTYFRQVRPGRMVITGAPGAGKTALAVELLLGLLEERAPEGPVPVRLSAAAWNTDQPLEAWLSAYLAQVYRVPLPTARALVAARRVLPVVDGLDEMDEDSALTFGSRAAQAVRALNAYQQGRGKGDLVLTCRSGQYEALQRAGVALQDAARVEIRPVNAVKTRDFLQERVTDIARWRRVQHMIDQDEYGPLAQGMSTPWRLTLAVIVYEQRDPRTGDYLYDPDALLAPALNTAEAVRDHLLSLFIPAATSVHSSPEGACYAPERVHTWLAVLAGYLSRNGATGRRVEGRSLSGTDMVLHELWPLAGARSPRVVHAALLIGAWIATAAAVMAWVPTSPTPLLWSAVALWAMAALWPAFVAWHDAWPRTTRADLRRLRTRSGARRLMSGVPVGLAGGGVAGVGVAIVAGATAGSVVGLVTALVAGVAAGLAAPGPIGAGNPGDMVRADLAFGLGFGLMAGLATGLTAGLAGPVGGGVMAVAGGVLGGVAGRAFGTVASGALFGLTGGGALTFMSVLVADRSGVLSGVLTACLAGGLTIGIGGGPVFGLAGGLAGTRYIALLLCTRRWSDHWLPWRLVRFLNWCCGAALVRVAGSGYQFRHRELQDYLARHPHP
ncbi:NACHT domain-containing protein [Streptomyces sp. NPDC086081]|uniref:NACHT domain-containing protein n=1 Tax=Streptomyces sp. NPDC086081 TaxID=3365749 RepID=UPI00382EEC8D